MKVKNWLLGLTAVCVGGVGVFVLGTALRKDEDEHGLRCTFTANVNDGALATPATCTQKATYYYSCALCSAIDESQTFEYGEALGHTGGTATCVDKAICEVCNEPYGEATGIHTGGVATCSQKPICEVCGGEYGTTVHVFDREIVAEEYKSADANCSHKTTYYKSCECGEKGEETFEYGNLGEHSIENGACKYCEITESLGLKYSLSEDKSYYVVSGRGTCTDEVLVIPAMHEGKEVKAIGAGAFIGDVSLTNVILGANIDTVGSDAFNGCENIVELDLTANVKVIGRNAFENCTNLSSLILPEQMTDLGAEAFKGCEKLVTVKIPGQVETIGAGAFMDCISLKEVGISEGVKTIGVSAFENCEVLSKLTLPQSLQSLGNSAFMNCASLQSAVVPTGVTLIGEAAFAGCVSMKTVELADGVSIIGDGAFYGCESLQTVKLGSGITKIKPFAFFGCDVADVNYGGDVASWCKIQGLETLLENGFDFYLSGEKVTTLTIPETVESVNEEMFRKISSIEKVIFKNNATSIGSNAFNGCENLTTVELGDSINNIGSYAFANSNLQNVYYTKDIADWCQLTNFGTENNPMYYARNLYIKGELLVDLVIPETVTQIKYKTFENCQSIESVTLHDNVTSIGSSAFYNCIKLKTLKAGDVVASIGSNAFAESGLQNVYYTKTMEDWCNLNLTAGERNPMYYAQNLYVGDSLVENLVIPAAVTEIKQNAFYNCRSIKSVEIPATVTSIANGAFYGCSAIESMKLAYVGNKADNTTYGLGYIFGNYEYVGSVSAYQDTTYYLPAKLTSVTLTGDKVIDKAFRNAKNLKNVTLSGNVTSIGEYAFADCESLQQIALPATLEEIKSFAFSACGSLQNVAFGDKVAKVANGAFNGCASLKSVAFGAEDVVIGDSAFIECSALQNATFSKKVQSIGSHAFGACASLQNVTFNGNVDSIGNYAFSGCAALQNVTFTSDVKSVGDYAFEKCTALKTVALPENATLQTVGTYAFSGCTALESIAVGGNGMINENAFKDCTSLQKVTLGEGLTAIGEGSFENCVGLTSVVIPDSVTKIGSKAFADCSYLTSVHLGAGLKKVVENAFDDDNDGTMDRFEYKADLPIYNDSFVGCYRLVEVVNKSESIEVKAGNSDNGGVAKYALGVYNADDTFGASKLSTKNGYTIYTDGEEKILVSYIGKETTLNIPEEITQINAYAFKDCVGLTSVTLGANVKAIGNYAFAGCNGLTSITLGEGLTTIGNYAFEGCDGLTSVVIPANVTSIGAHVFKACDKLTSVAFETTAGWNVSEETIAIPSLAAEALKDDNDYAWTRA